MNSLSSRLQKCIDHFHPLLKEITAVVAADKPNPVKWSRKEFLGHLIDSASNNHQRFVRVQAQNDLIFQGYDQNEWVRVQGYQMQEWEEVISLWYQYNHHLASVIQNIPEHILNQERKTHNLDQIAFKTVPKNESTTLAYFVTDYINHLEYHMAQILNYPYS